MNGKVMMRRASMQGMFLALFILLSPAVLAADSEWEYSADVYLWGSKLGVTTPGG